jgi:malonyl-CoA decarboxylase
MGLTESLKKPFKKSRDTVKDWLDSLGGLLERDSWGQDTRPEDYDDQSIRRLFDECLGAKTGLKKRNKAREIGQLYNQADEDKRLDMLREMVDYSLEPDTIQQALENFRRNPGNPDVYADLMDSTNAPRVNLLKSLNSLPSGFQFLVNLRSDLIEFRREHEELAILDVDLRYLLEMWFDVDLLSFQRITWDSPASLLEKLIDYEDVHQITSWDDLKNRLKKDRRCYALMHPKMPEEPLIFVEIALTDGLPDTIDGVLDEDQPVLDPDGTDTAVFYSISNTQPGLRGISFGNFLLERVIEDLEQELPNLERYVTLSPIPGFRNWVQDILDESPEKLLETMRQSDRKQLEKREDEPAEALKSMVDSPDPNRLDPLRESLLDLVAHYLLDVRREDGLPVDPVARFHLRNGARVEQLNWMGDPSDNGLENALGIMVNYRYGLPYLEENHRMLLEDHRVPARSSVRERADRITDLPKN